MKKNTGKRDFRVSVISATMRIALRSNFLISNYLNHVPFHDGNYFIFVILCRLPFERRVFTLRHGKLLLRMKLNNSS